MSTSRITSKCIAGGLLLALAGTAGVARADCAADGSVAAGGSGVCYKLKGSDTLFDIMTKAISDARAGTSGGVAIDAATQAAAKDLFYEGTGSGNAETAMRTATATGLGVQSIGPMSRNFRPSIIDASSPDYVARTAGGTQNGHAAWAPTTANVVGLDAAVFVVKANAALADIDFPTFNDTAVPTAFRKAVMNNAGLTAAFGNPGAFNNLSAAVNYSNLMSVVLSGVDGSGTLAACADPRRVQAVQDIAGLTGASTLAHVMRRDDNSGTTDTFKDRIMVVANSGTIAPRYPWTGGRFCNGTAVGGISGAAVQQGICSNARTTYCTSNTVCGTGVCQFNLNNQDFDPIRRPCMAASATAAPTSCTDMTTGLPCQAGDGNANCTQGLVVALSDTDPGSSDITTSIGRRIGNASGEIIGYAGREAGSATFGTKTLNINTIQSIDDRVRDSTYLLARRLFIQNSAANSVVGSPDYPNDNQTANSNTGGGTDQLTKEQLLWNGILTNRFAMDPIVRGFNFIRCGTVDGEDPGTLSNNLCSIVPAAPVPGALGAYLPSGAVSGANGGAKAIAFDGRVPTTVTTGTGVTSGWQNGRACTAAAPCTCSTTTPCLGLPLVSVTSAAAALCVTGGSAPAGGACPAPALRPSNAPCTVNAECSSGTCADRFAHSTGGVDGLYCN
jgi:hypothetical protein